MSSFEIDREMLESYSTSEIKRILREDYDDYTPEAIEIFKDILEARGDDSVKHGVAPSPQVSASGRVDQFRHSLPVNNPADAIDFLNDLLSGVLNGTIDTAKAQVSVEIVSVLLKAHEASLMMESDGE